jgi:hypothetical protein
MAVWALSTTHSGTSEVGVARPAAMRRAKMIPIVFWASLAPCPRLKAAAESSWPRRKPRLRSSTRRQRWNAHMISTVTMSARARPTRGDSTMKTPILRRPSGTRTSKPARATAAPAIPPTRACEELDGSPR